MKLIGILIFGAVLLVNAGNSYAQQIKLTLDLKNTSVKEVLQTIENNSEFSFMYDNNKVDVSGQVSVKAVKQTIDDILKQVFAGTGVNYEVIDRHIILIPAAIPVKTQETASQPQGTVTGRVTDRNGAPLPGVTVVVKGTTVGTITNADGSYSLSNIPSGATLVFSFVGMRTQEVAVAGKTSINISLEEETIGIEEVVAIGYGTVKKSDLTGSVSTIGNTELEQVASHSILQKMQGQAAGVHITENIARPGGNISLRIRGNSSLGGGNEPLYVVDGFVGVGNISSINPNDIESISILKDASAIAVYGARGTNGVVLITTKSGSAGKTEINVDTYYGIQQISKKLDLLNATQYAELVNDAATRSGFQPVFNNTASLGKGTDWQDQMYRPAPIRNINLSYSEGSNNGNLFMSLDYFNQDGIVIGTGYERYSFRINTNKKIRDFISIGSTLSARKSETMQESLTNQIYENKGKSGIGAALNSSPSETVYADDGSINMFTHADGWGTEIWNPVAWANEVDENTRNSALIATVYSTITLIPDLTFKTSFGIDAAFNNYFMYLPKTIYQGQAIQGEAKINKSSNFSWISTNNLTYDVLLNNTNRLTINAVAEFQSFDVESSVQTVRGFITDALKYYDLSSGANPLTPGSNNTLTSYAGFLGRVNYVLQDKYIFTLNGRYDGASVFGKNKKFNFFPSAALAWRVKGESFMENIETINELKLRASYGVSGNQAIPAYQSLLTMVSVNYPLNGGTAGIGFVPARIANPDLKWETTAQINLGVDIRLISNRIALTADVYRKKTSDLLLYRPTPPSSGFTGYFSNVGSIENKGLEFNLNTTNIRGGNFEWKSDFNISFNQTKVLKLAEEKEMLYGSAPSFDSAFGLISEGGILGNFYGFAIEGIFQTEQEYLTAPNHNAVGSKGPGYYKFADKNNDKVIDDMDKTIIGNANPDFIYGLRNTFSIKQFDLSVLLQGTYGNEILNFNQLDHPDNALVNKSSAVLARWKGEGTSNTIPVANASRLSVVASNMIEDGSFLRMKDVSLGYNFSVKEMKANIYLSGQNLFVLTKYSGYDPEVNTAVQTAGGSNDALGFNTEFWAYPKAKTFILGLRLKF